MTKQKNRNGTAMIHTHTSDEVDLSRHIQHKFVGLQKAIARRKIEPICLAFLSLHDTTAGDPVKLAEMFKRIYKKFSKSDIDLITSAFSHRHCFMCHNGFLPCKDCGESGFVKEGEKCMNCNGAGGESCEFCQGTGWVAPNTIPSEIIKDVHNRYIANVKKDLKDLKKMIGKLDSNNLELLSAEQRCGLIKRVMRLHARLNCLAGEEIVGGREKKRLLATASQLDSLLKTLQNA